MAKISTYPIISVPTIDDLLIGTDVNDLNITKNFTIGEIGNLIGQDYVPYIGATGNVNLGSFNITAAAFIVPGGLASQFVKADGSLDSTAYTPQTRTLTINGTTYNLSANRSWDLNTVDSLTTIGTSGAATYIGKVLNIPVYQAQGNYITQLSGEATGSGPGNTTVTLSNSAVIGKILTGLNVTGGTVVSTDTILQAFGKVQNQINGLTTGVTYQGVWNAATNVPFLQSSVGTQGYYYVVDVAGNTNLNGITDWQVGDWAIYNGTAWQKVDNTDAVVSVNGYVGAVVLTASDVGAVPTTRTLTINGVGYNLSLDRAWTVGDVRTDGSYANPSWITSLAWSKITSTPTTLAGYGITDGALNTRTLTINGTTYDLTANRTWNVGTVTSVGTSGPLTGGTITGSGTIGITQAGASSDGYLSSTDWNAFNSKQAAISVTAPITLVAGVLGITQSSSTTDGYLSSTDWNTFNSKVSGSGTANTLPMWGSASSLINSPLSYAADTFNFQYNSATGGTVNFTNSNGVAYAYTIQMNNFGSPRSTVHSYTDGLIIQSIGGTQVSRMFANGNFILGTGTVDNGYKLEITGNLYVNTIANATVDTDRFIVSDGGVIKYRTGAEILADIGAVSSVGLTMPAAFTVSNSPITSSGTIGVTAAGTAAQYIRGDGTLADFPTTGGGGSSVSYYLNGSVNQGTFGGNTYYEMSKTPILGAGTDFSIGSNGYIAQFITDAGDPNLLEIPGGNWNLEFYFSASSGGGSPNFYVELYKYNGTTFTLIASNSTSPELIAFGTTINPYFSSLAVSQTSLLATDRLAIRIYVNTSGRTITLHTENSHLCQIITTFTTGLTALNGLTDQVQYFQTGTSGTDFNISSLVDIHTFNLPTASATNRGALSAADWTTFNSKQNSLTLTTTGSSGAATLVGATLNIPNYGSALTAYVPYTGATGAVDLGTNAFSASQININGAAPTSGSYLGFKHATTVTSGVDGYTSMYTFGTNTIAFKSISGATTKDFSFSMASITPGVPGGRVYTLPDATGTIALVGGSGVGTVTSVAALTLGTSGTDLSSTVADSTTTPVITLNVPTASATNRGALSAADWTTFNNKQNALTNPVTGTGTTNRLPKFTGASTIGNSNISDGGVTILNENPTAGQFAWQFNGNTTTGLSFGASVVAGTNSSDIAFRVLNAAASSSYFVIRGDGNVGIGTTGPTQKITTVGSYVRYHALSEDNTNAGAYFQVKSGSTTVGQSSQFVDNAGNWIIYTGTSSEAERLRITSSGNVGIGTAPASKLDVLGEIRSTSTSGYAALLSISALGYSILADTHIGGAMTIWTAGSEKMRITSSGNLLVGTTTDAGYKLDVNGTGRFSASSAALSISNASDLWYNITRGSSFTNIGVDSTGSFYNTNTSHRFLTNSGSTTALTITSGGNVGIGVVPSAWSVLSPAIEMGTGGSFISAQGSTSAIYIGTNAFFNGSNFIYKTNGAATYSIQNAGSHQWFTAPSGTAGNVVSFTQAMTLTSGGNLLVGTTTDSGFKLDVNGTGRFFRNDSANISLTISNSFINQGNLINFIHNSNGSTTNAFIGHGGDSTGNLIFINNSIQALTIARATGAATFSTTSGNGITIVTNDVTTLKMNSTSGATKNWGFASTNLAASDFGIYQSNSNGGDAINAGTARMYFSGSGNVLIGTTTDVGARLYVDGAFRTGTLTAGTQTAAVDWRLGNARGGTATANALIRVQINGVLVDLIGNYV